MLRGWLAGFECLLILVTCGVPLQAQTQSVTLAWDSTSDPTVIGYIVYVGTEPGSPTESYQVHDTSFVYAKAASDRPYFFSVAAYSAGPSVGSRSDEVLFLGGNQVTQARDAVAAPTDHSNSEPRRAVSRTVDARAQTACLSAQPLECFVNAGSVGDFGRIDAVATLGDGRLIFIENGVRIVILAAGSTGDVGTAALTASGDSLMSVAVDPKFLSTHYVYVAETERSTDGPLETIVARYREVNGILGERDVVVAGLADPGGGAARIAVDGSDHLFVAMPRGLANSPGMDAGMLLRFRRDGSVPPDNAAVSPVYSTGASDPAALAWSPSEDSLWLVDSVSDRIARYRLHLDAARAIPADHLETLNPGVSMLPITSITFNPFDVQRPTNPVIVAGHPSDVLNVSDDGVGTLHVTPLPSMLMGGEPIAAVNNLDEIDVVVRVSDVNAPIASRIVRLRRQFPLY